MVISRLQKPGTKITVFELGVSLCVKTSKDLWERCNEHINHVFKVLRNIIKIKKFSDVRVYVRLTCYLCFYYVLFIFSGKIVS